MKTPEEIKEEIVTKFYDLDLGMPIGKTYKEISLSVALIHVNGILNNYFDDLKICREEGLKQSEGLAAGNIVIWKQVEKLIEKELNETS